MILGQTGSHGEKVITIDDLLVSDVFLSNYEEAKNHYDVRSELTTQMGQALAQVYDRQLFAVALKAIEDGAAGVAGQGNATRNALGLSPTTATIIDGIYAAAQNFDEKNIPENGRTCFVPPSVYYALVKDDATLDRDFGVRSGSRQDGTIFGLAGFEIVKTNNMAVNHTTNTLQGEQAGVATTDYAVDGSNYSFMCMQTQALGSVHLMDISSESEYQIERQGTLMVSRMANGRGVLRPECLYGGEAA